MDEPQMIEEIVPKKSRHRKKLLYSSIKDQMEFYFSDVNISKDRFISQLMQEDPYIDLTVFLQFNKIRRLTDSISDLCKAISKSDILELSEDNLKVCRKTPIRVKENEDECTIYVERLPADAEHEWVRNIFTKFGPVDYVSIPRYTHNRMIKGFAFIEFDSPETAIKALEYFESIGCKLPTTMLPDQLISISSFDPEKSEKNQNIFNKFTTEVKTTENIKQFSENEANVSKTDTEETEIKVKRKKRKETDDATETSEVKRKKKEKPDTATEPEHTNKSEKPEESSINEFKKNKDEKQTKDAENKAAENKEIESEEKKKEIQETGLEINDKTVETEGQEECKDEDVLGEKKKRKRKKCKSHSNDLQQYGFQVLSKKEWKQLRNKYLNLQRQKMQNLKEHFQKKRFTNVQNNEDNRSEDKHSSENNHVKISTPRFEFAPGAIVQIILKETFNDAKKFKNDIRSQPGLQYIDLQIGSNVGYLRFSDNNSAKKFCELDNINANTTILEGNEEKLYWDQLLQLREEKFKKDTNKNKQRGRDKLLRKAEKELGKHIRFENGE